MRKALRSMRNESDKACHSDCTLVVGTLRYVRFSMICRNVLMGPDVSFNPCGYEHRQMALSLHKIKIYVIRNNSNDDHKC